MVLTPFVSGHSVKMVNRSLILKAIRQYSPITKIALAEQFGLTSAAVGNIITELSEADLIEESGYAVSSGGRPPILYTMKWDSVYVIGIVIDVEDIRVSLVDLKGNVQEETTVELESHSLIDRVYQLIDRLLNRTPVDKTKIAGIGVSSPGPIDTAGGKVLTPPNLVGIRNLDIKQQLENRYNLPTILEKDANAFALAEQWFGQVEPTDDILYIYNDLGLGSGLIIDSRIHRGFGYGAGEIGHMVVDIDGPKCNCGNFGCLETFSSGIAMQRRVREEIKRSYPTTLAPSDMNDDKQPTVKEIIREAEKGDALSQQVLYESERYLGMGIANAINLFSPNQIVFGGLVTDSYPKMIYTVKEIAIQRALSPYAGEITFSVSAFSNQSTALGAAAVIQQALFDNPESILI